MSTLLQRVAIGAVSLLAGIVGLSTPMQAASYSVFVGYSDGLRGPGFFPNPWAGDPGVTFLGSGPPFDAGAIMIRNDGGAALTVDSIGVNINGTPVAPPWALPQVIAPGHFLIVTQTTQYDFDTSDVHAPLIANGVPVTNCTIICPTVTIGVNGTAGVLYKDSAHTLDTLGYDFAFDGSNESFNWRRIGTCSGPGCGSTIGQTPLPAALPLYAAGLGFAGLLGWRRRKKERAATA
jgi:hypothetical protein